MTDRLFRQLMIGLFACILPLLAYGTTDQAVSEKRIQVAMRMIGHEVLTSLGDKESRVMPIEKIGDHYKISFEFELGFDPDSIVNIIHRVMAKTGISSGYLVEVQRCAPSEIVHSFLVENASNSLTIPCRGRVLPKDCYSLFITFLEHPPLSANAVPLQWPYFISPLILLLGIIGYFRLKKNPAAKDPNLIRIGATRFDKKKMVLSFKDQQVDLSHKEAELLALLHASANTPLERELMLQEVWGDEGDYVGRTLDVFISKLRKKLEADTSVKIVNIRGVGYKLVVNTPG